MADTVTKLLRFERETKGTIVYVDTDDGTPTSLKGIYIPRALAEELSDDRKYPTTISLTFQDAS